MSAMTDLIRVLLTEAEAEDLCWAYCGHAPAQRSQHTRDARNRFRLASRYEVAASRDRKPPRDGWIAVDLPRVEAEALGFNTGSDELVAQALERVERALGGGKGDDDD